MKKYDMTNLIDMEDGETMVCTNSIHDSLELIVVDREYDPEGNLTNARLKFVETSGETRDVWKMRTGLVTQDEALEIEARTVKKENRRVIYDKLRAEFDKDLALVDRKTIDELTSVNTKLVQRNDALQGQIEHMMTLLNSRSR